MTILLFTFLSLLLLNTPAWADHQGTKPIQREIAWYYHFHKEIPNSSVETWYENGQKKSEAIFKDGKKDGPWTYWYETGQKKGEGTFKDGELDGLSTLWYENGQKKSEGTFKDGKEDGLTIYWDTHGNIIMQRNYKNGAEVK